MSKGKTIRCFDYINHPYVTVRDALSADVPIIFRDATKAAALRAKTVASELRVNIGAIEVGTDISISVKKIEKSPMEVTTPAHTRLELEWEATKMPRLFPFMKAELSIYPLTATETQLEFLGNYDPPLGVLGDAVDAVVGHRIAEASVHRFIKEIASYLRQELSDKD